MRPVCLNCARKHLAQASILMSEAAQGYPLHAWLAMGHMAEAADELVAEYPEMANVIREHRKIYEEAVNEAEDPTNAEQPELPMIDCNKMIAEISELARDVDVKNHKQLQPYANTSDVPPMPGEPEGGLVSPGSPPEDIT
jgi:hypothetical protein